MRRQLDGVVIFTAEVWDEKKEYFSCQGENGTFKMGNTQYVWMSFRLTE
jgi:hypothetical protein